MSEKIRHRVTDPAKCKHERNHVCEHGLVDHCHYGPIFCGICGLNLTEQMEKDLLKTYPELSREGAKTSD